MATSLVHSTAGLLWFTPAASPTNDMPSQAEVTVIIADGDLDVELRTGTTSQSSKRDYLIKLFVIATTRLYLRNKKGDGADGIQTPSGSINFTTPDFFKEYKEACATYAETQDVSTGKNPYYFLGAS
jgi:hypothetical protein